MNDLLFIKVILEDSENLKFIYALLVGLRIC